MVINKRLEKYRKFVFYKLKFVRNAFVSSSFDLVSASASKISSHVIT